MTKRKLVSLSLISLAFLVLAGCGNKSQDQNQNQEQAQERNSNQNAFQEREAGNSKNNGGPQDGKEQAGPPEEAQVACADKSEGDECSFIMTRANGEEEEVSGTCSQMLLLGSDGDSDNLVCSSGEMRGPGGPAPNGNSK